IVLIAGCASYPAPVQRMADAEAAARVAQETGAASIPRAQLHLGLAQEEIARAKQLMNDGDNESASSMLLRAKSDADLAQDEARAEGAQAKAQKAMQDLAAAQASAPPSSRSITTTTSATTIVPPPAPPPPTTTTTTTTTTEGKP